jgi:hypothetical protein
VDDDLQRCECCDAVVPIETMSSCGDGCWICPKCAAQAAQEFAACDHVWQPERDAHGDPGQYCGKCGHIVLNEDFEAVFGRPAP